MKISKAKKNARLALFRRGVHGKDFRAAIKGTVDYITKKQLEPMMPKRFWKSAFPLGPGRHPKNAGDALTT